jgi:hypothetical protein
VGEVFHCLRAFSVNLLTIREAADELRLSKTTILRLLGGGISKHADAAFPSASGAGC